MRWTGGRCFSVLLTAIQIFTIGDGFKPHKDDAEATPIQIGGSMRVFVDGRERMKI
jgi:hypothetical protein